MKAYSRLDVKSHAHPKVRHLGNAAWGAFLRLVAYSNDYLRDGFVDAATARDICRDGELERLLAPFPWGDGPMLEQADGGFRIRGFVGDWNDSSEVVFSRSSSLSQLRSEAGKRGGIASGKARRSSRSKTEAKPKPLGDGVGSGSDLKGEVQERVQPPDPSSGVYPVAPAPRIGAPQLELRPPYERGIEAGSGVPVALRWAPWDQQALVAAVAKFGRADTGRPLEGPRLLAWVEAAAREFASAVTRAKREQFYGGFEPAGFARWLAEDELAERRRRRGAA